MTPLVELRGITKRFGPVEVLTDVDLDLHAGRVHSLAGENGAGKSTLVKILGGIHQPDSGRILIDGAEVAIRGAADAQRHGHRGRSTSTRRSSPTCRSPRTCSSAASRGGGAGSTGRRCAREARRTARAPATWRSTSALPVKMLGIAERQTIEIVRALSLDARVLVMDEPTSAISSSEVDRLFEIVLRAQAARRRDSVHQPFHRRDPAAWATT